MTIQFRCPYCEHKLRAPDTAAGQQARCKCGRSVVVPSTSEPEFAPLPADSARPTRSVHVSPIPLSTTGGAEAGNYGGGPSAGEPENAAVATTWYYRHDGHLCGPVPWPQLCDLAASGALQPTDLVWREGSDRRIPASAVKGLVFPTTADRMSAAVEAPVHWHAPASPAGPVPPSLWDRGLLSLVGVVLLHYGTCGIFSTIWMALMHGKLPKTRDTDPSAAKAVGLCFVPFYNIGWFCFILARLVARVNEQRQSRGLPETKAHWLANAVIFSTLAGIGMSLLAALLGPDTGLGEVVQGCATLLAMANWAVLVPLLLSVMQANMNLFAEGEQGPPRLDELTKSCPDCGETIAAAATACISCGRQFTPQEMARAKAKFLARSKARTKLHELSDLRLKGQLFLCWALFGIVVGTLLSFVLLAFSKLSELWASGDRALVLFAMLTALLPLLGGIVLLTQALRVGLLLRNTASGVPEGQEVRP